MINFSESMYKSVTDNDLILAAFYYPILIDLGKNKQTLEYGQFVETAKSIYPNSQLIQNAIATTIGRPLDVIRLFAKDKKILDITALLINKHTLKSGNKIENPELQEKTREKVLAFNWNNAPEFDLYEGVVDEWAVPRPRFDEEAKRLMSDYYRNNKSNLPAFVSSHRDTIIDLLKSGLSAKQAFEQIINKSYSVQEF
jgi:hypothetical protein